jgi:hypothetical protein
MHVEKRHGSPEEALDPPGIRSTFLGEREECGASAVHSGKAKHGDSRLLTPIQPNSKPSATQASSVGLRECLYALGTSSLSRTVSDLRQKGHEEQGTQVSSLLKQTVDLLEGQDDTRFEAVSSLLLDFHALAAECEQQRCLGAWDCAAWQECLIFAHMYVSKENAMEFLLIEFAALLVAACHPAVDILQIMKCCHIWSVALTCVGTKTCYKSLPIG